MTGPTLETEVVNELGKTVDRQHSIDDRSNPGDIVEMDVVAKALDEQMVQNAHDTDMV